VDRLRATQYWTTVYRILTGERSGFDETKVELQLSACTCQEGGHK
jgi:hypothetical protein